MAGGRVTPPVAPAARISTGADAERRSSGVASGPGRRFSARGRWFSADRRIVRARGAPAVPMVADRRSPIGTPGVESSDRAEALTGAADAAAAASGPDVFDSSVDRFGDSADTGAPKRRAMALAIARGSMANNGELSAGTEFGTAGVAAGVADEPVANEPAVDEPVADEPAADEPADDEPPADAPPANAPAADEPAPDDAAVEESPVGTAPEGNAAPRSGVRRRSEIGCSSAAETAGPATDTAGPATEGPGVTGVAALPDTGTVTTGVDAVGTARIPAATVVSVEASDVATTDPAETAPADTERPAIGALGRAQDRRRLLAGTGAATADVALPSGRAAVIGVALPLPEPAEPRDVTAARRTGGVFSARRAAALSTARRRATHPNGPRAGTRPERPGSVPPRPKTPRAEGAVVEPVTTPAPETPDADRGTAAVRRITPSPADVPGGPAAPRVAGPDVGRPASNTGGVARGTSNLRAASAIVPAALTSGSRRTWIVLPVMVAAIPPGTWVFSVGTGPAARRRPRGGVGGNDD